MELLLPVDFAIVGLVLTFIGCVLVVGVVNVLDVIVGFVVAGLVVKDVLGAKEVLGTEEVFVVKDGLLEPPEPPVEVSDDGRPPEIDGALPPPRITLSSGER
jgi:hypothetical protein